MILWNNVLREMMPEAYLKHMRENSVTFTHLSNAIKFGQDTDIRRNRNMFALTYHMQNVTHFNIKNVKLNWTNP